MLIDNLVYEQKYNFTINQYEGPFFYYFDWDERSYQINMEFQHFHQYYEMCIFLDEQAGHLINGAWHDMRCCDIVAIRPSLLHRTSYPEGAPNKRLIIQFAFPNMPSPLDSYMKKILSIFTKEVPIYRFEGKYKNIILEKLNDIYYLSKTPNEMTDLSIHNKFVEFLSLIYLYRSQNVYQQNVDFDNITNKVYSITTYIHNNYTEDLSLNSIADQFYVSNYYLSHQFKKVTGFTLTEYIQLTRIRNAQSLLISTNKPITDIAFLSGFSSFSQFNRVFNNFVGTSPSKFRKNNQKP
jgi:AraC-like DNA-binding protein